VSPPERARPPDKSQGAFQTNQTGWEPFDTGSLPETGVCHLIRDGEPCGKTLAEHYDELHALRKDHLRPMLEWFVANADKLGVAPGRHERLMVAVGRSKNVVTKQTDDLLAMGMLMIWSPDNGRAGQCREYLVVPLASAATITEAKKRARRWAKWLRERKRKAAFAKLRRLEERVERDDRGRFLPVSDPAGQGVLTVNPMGSPNGDGGNGDDTETTKPIACPVSDPCPPGLPVLVRDDSDHGTDRYGETFVVVADDECFRPELFASLDDHLASGAAFPEHDPHHWMGATTTRAARRRPGARHRQAATLRSTRGHHHFHEGETP
jgi:hypothetical protein